MSSSKTNVHYVGSCPFFVSLYDVHHILIFPEVSRLLRYLPGFLGTVSILYSFQTSCISYIAIDISEAFTIYTNLYQKGFFLKRTVILLPTTVLFKLCHFVHSMTYLSYFHFSIYIFYIYHA